MKTQPIAAPQIVWLVEIQLSGELAYCHFDDLPKAIAYMGNNRTQAPVLWQRAPFAVSFPSDEAAAPPAKPQRKKRKNSPAAAAGATPEPPSGNGGGPREEGEKEPTKDLGAEGKQVAGEEEVRTPRAAPARAQEKSEDREAGASQRPAGSDAGSGGPPTAPAAAKKPKKLACGGTNCTDDGKTEHHDPNDLTCRRRIIRSVLR